MHWGMETDALVELTGRQYNRNGELPVQWETTSQEHKKVIDKEDIQCSLWLSHVSVWACALMNTYAYTTHTLRIFEKKREMKNKSLQ